MRILFIIAIGTLLNVALHYMFNFKNTASNPDSHKINIPIPTELTEFCNKMKSEAENPNSTLKLGFRDLSAITKDYPNFWAQGKGNAFYFQYSNELSCLVLTDRDNKPIHARIIYTFN